MIAFILRRLLLMIPTTLGVALVIFSIFHLAPGDPATVMLGISGGGAMSGDVDMESRIAKFEIEHGLDRNPAIQFLSYIGPVNFMRDGHGFFSSPYGERKISVVELPDGGEVVEGLPMRIDYPPEVASEQRALSDAHVATLATRDASEQELEPARAALAEAGEAALPALLSELNRQTLRLEDPVIAERLAEVLSGITGRDDAAAWERGPLAAVRGWFGWYYTEGGGGRVKNSGEKPWGGLFLGELGSEMQSNASVAAELWKRLKVTVPISLVSVLLAYLIALPLGIFSARRQGTLVDNASTVVLFVLYSIPSFWAGLMLIIVFGKTGPLAFFELPVLGLKSIDYETFSSWGKFKDLALHCVLPVVTLTYGSFAYLSRQMRGGMLDVIRQDYIRTARAKGLSERVVIYKHTLRNSLIPVITLFASILPILIGGSIIVEQVFDLPGMGRYAFEGLLRRDFYIIMATTIFVGIMTQIGILLSDVTYSAVDPRIRHD